MTFQFSPHRPEPPRRWQLRCTFCGKGVEEVMLFPAPDATICSECVLACAALIPDATEQLRRRE